MTDKPTDLPEWATGPTADVQEPPPGKKAGGWQLLEKPPHQWFNWFFNLVYSWLAFLKDYAEGHAHDGGVSDTSAPKVDFTDHINYGEHGELEVETDSVGKHVIEHRNTSGGDAHFVTDALSSDRLFTNAIKTGVEQVANPVLLLETFMEHLGAPLKVFVRGFVEADNVPDTLVVVDKNGVMGGTVGTGFTVEYVGTGQWKLNYGSSVSYGDFIVHVTPLGGGVAIPSVRYDGANHYWVIEFFDGSGAVVDLVQFSLFIKYIG